MMSTTHALIGAAIATKIPQPEIAAGLSLTTHLLCDMIPHWDFGTNWRRRPKHVTGAWAIIDTLFAFIGVYLFFANFVNNFTLLVAIFFSLLPDLLEAPHYLFPGKYTQIFYYIYKFQSFLHSRMELPWGLVTQILTAVIFLYVGFMT